MAVKGLESHARLPRAGVIRLGIKKLHAQSGKEYPEETPYFVLPTDLRAKLGDRPTAIAVLFPADDPDRVFPTSYERWQGTPGKAPLLTLRCDGERYVELPVAGGELVGACKLPAWEPGQRRRPCPCGAKVMGRLNVIPLEAPFGVWQVPMGGWQRCADVLGELQIFRRELGRLTDLVFSIERVPTVSQVTTEKGGRLAKTGYPVHVRCAFTAKQALALRGLAFGAQGLPAAAPPVEPEEPEEALPPEAQAEEEWTVERCFREAAGLGVPTDAYREWLARAYRGGVEAMNLTDLAAEATALSAALADPAAADRWRARVLTVEPARR